MSTTQAFRSRIRIGFAVVVLLAGTIAVVSLFALRSVIDTKDRVISEFSHDIVETRELEVAAEQLVSNSRAFLLTRDSRYLQRAAEARAVYLSRLDLLREDAALPGETELIQKALEAAAAHQQALDQAVSAERKEEDLLKAAELFEEVIQPRSRALRETLDSLSQEKDGLVAAAVRDSRRGARRATLMVGALGGAAALLAGGLFFLSTRTLKRLERTELEIRDLNEHLENRVQERTRDIEAFAYSVAHDLRSPLRAMAGWGEIVISDYGPRLDEAGRDALLRIRKAALRMDDLISGLLGLARLSIEPFPRTTVDVADVLRRTLTSRESEIRARGATVDQQVSSQTVRAHPWLLALALDHLVSNGLKFVAPGVPPQLRCWSEAHGDRIRIHVADNGIGIPPEYHARIFGTFERLHTSDVYAGVGVGLAIVKRAVERMGGSVGVSSVPGVGSLFWIDLDAAGVPAPVVSASRA